VESGTGTSWQAKAPAPPSWQSRQSPSYFRKTNHSLAAKFRREHSAMARPPAR
jgi:hypothetical protein